VRTFESYRGHQLEASNSNTSPTLVANVMQACDLRQRGPVPDLAPHMRPDPLPDEQALLLSAASIHGLRAVRSGKPLLPPYLSCRHTAMRQASEAVTATWPQIGHTGITRAGKVRRSPTRRSGRMRSHSRWTNSAAQLMGSWNFPRSLPGVAGAGLISMTATIAPQRTRSSSRRAGRGLPALSQRPAAAALLAQHPAGPPDPGSVGGALP
jgi:hypothetical protein